MTTYEWQCCTCGAVHTLDRAPATDERRECPDCALHGRPRFPLWRWRRVDPGTPADQLAGLRLGRAVIRAVARQYGVR